MLSYEIWKDHKKADIWWQNLKDWLHGEFLPYELVISDKNLLS